MRRRPSLFAVTFVPAFLFLTFLPAPARAQIPDAIGIRAQGMAGAFTAIADDSTATWWNPAGIATGSYLSLTVEYGQATETDLDHRGFALAFPALGLSYYRMPVSEIRASSSTAGTAAGRQDLGVAGVRTVELSQFGATVGQSLGGHLVLASTVKLLHAQDDSEGGLDIGGMAIFGLFRAGVVARNLREPKFGEGDDEITLRRQVRAGVALSTVGRNAVISGATLSLDADILHVTSPTGEERRIGGGAELWLMRRFIGVRGGVSGSTVGDSRFAYSGGASVAVKSGIYIDGQLTGGSDDSRRGWGAAFRLTF